MSAVASRVVRSPRGTQLSTLGWPQEAPFRMIQNNLDPDVAERPGDLIVYGGTLDGRLVVSAGLGGMGGAQPLAITMNGGVALVVEIDPTRAERRIEQGFLDEMTDSLDDALARAEGYLGSRTPRSIGLVANAAAVLPELVRRGVRVDVVTDQTSAHDPLDGYVPDVRHAGVLRINDPAGSIEGP